MGEEETNADPTGSPLSSPELEAHAYTDGASAGSRGPGGYGAVVTWNGKTEEISGGEPDTTNQRMELTAACVALETIDEGHIVTVYSDSSYLVNRMRRGWHETWQKNGWLNNLQEPVANRDPWERLLGAVRPHREVRWRKVKGHQKGGARTRPGTTGPTSSPWPRRRRPAATGEPARRLPGERKAPRLAGKQALHPPRLGVLDGSGVLVAEICLDHDKERDGVADIR